MNMEDHCGALSSHSEKAIRFAIFFCLHLLDRVCGNGCAALQRKNSAEDGVSSSRTAVSEEALFKVAVRKPT